LIAVGQFIIAFGMLLKGIWVKLSCIGSIIFLLAIAPCSSAFPFSITVFLAAFLIYKNDEKNYIRKKQLRAILQ
jgi:hypothetical protein